MATNILSYKFSDTSILYIYAALNVYGYYTYFNNSLCHILHD